MSVTEMIDSGVLELYCLGIADAETVALVENLASKNESVRKEIREISDALAKYATTFSPDTSARVKQEVFNHVEISKKGIPLVTPQSKPEEWHQYLKAISVKAPEDFEVLAMHELPEDEKQYTFILWGKQGSGIPEEIHTGTDEHVLICSGSCEMLMDGKVVPFKAGDYFLVIPGTVHSGIVTSKEGMMAVVQRRAA